ncbi:MAG: PAS domain-containing protein, partial [Bauldia litoralis]
WFWETDADLKLANISGRFEANSEAAGRQAIGKSRFEVASAAELARNPERWRDHKETLERREPFRSFEFELETESGDHRLISSSGVPVFDETGAFRGYRGGATDVTEQRQAEHNAAVALEQLEFLANTVPALITSIDREGRFQLVNRQAEAWYARPRDQIIGRKMEDIFGPAEIDIFQPFYREVAEGREVSKELEIAYPDGETRHVTIRWVPRMRDGDYDGFVALVVDMSDQYALQETLRQSQKMEALGQLTGGVAHDFNNLLLAIQGNLELLREDMADADPGVRLVTNSLRGVERAAELTRRLLAFSRRQPFMQETVQIDRMVHDMKEMLSRLLEENIAIEVAFGDRELTARTDRAQLENAVLNLAINARDAMPEGGTLTVRADVVELDAHAVAGHDNALPGRFICLSVADTGRGMTPETCRRALEPFFTTKDIGAGTGLGLSMVHGFVQQSGGFIEIDSKPDWGTTIHLYLPADEPCETVNETEAKCAVTVPRASKNDSRILLVEDEPLVREVASLTLKALGYSVTEAANGVEALDVLRREAPFDLLLTDIVMPGGVSGIDLVDQAFRLQPGIRAIMATGHIGSGEQAAAERMPHVPVLRKPFSRETLGRSISTALAASQTGPDTARAASA